MDAKVRNTPQNTVEAPDVPQNSEENYEEAAIDEQALNEDGHLDAQEGSTSTDVPQNPQQNPEEAAIDDGCSGESKNKKKRANKEARLDDWLTEAYKPKHSKRVTRQSSKYTD